MFLQEQEGGARALIFGTLAKQWDISFHDAPAFSRLDVGVERTSGQRLGDNFIVQTEL